MFHALAVCSASAGIIHDLAARQHAAHPQVVVFFVALALAQMAWAGYVLVASRRVVLLLGMAGNASIVLLWLASRTTGVPFVPGHSGPEPVGAWDLTATLLEVAIVAGLVYALDFRVERRLRLYPRELAAGALAAGLVVLALPPVLGTPAGARNHAGHILGLHELTHGHPGAHLHAAGHVGHDPAAGHAGHDAAAHSVHGDHASIHELHTQHLAGHVHQAAAPPPPPLRGVATTVRYGPFTLAPARIESGKSASPALSNIIRTRLEPPCTNCYVTSVEPDLVYTDGSRANFNTGAMLHHAVIGDSNQTDLTCGRGSSIGWLGRRIFAAGNERTKGVLPAPFGYRIGGSDWLTGIFEIMNFEQAPQTVWFKLTAHYLPASDARVRPVVPVWLDENNCGSSEYSIPAGRSTRKWDWTSSITGRVVFVGGHVHNWGREITLSNATTGEQMCKSVAGYGTKPDYQGNIESMTSCAWDRLGTVRTGQKLDIAAVYDSPQARSDVMGIMLAYVYETNDLSGGTAAPDSVRDPPDAGPKPHPSHSH